VYVGIEHGLGLDRRLEARVDAMLDQGFVEEVEELCRRGYRDCRAMKSVGYRQVLALLASEPRPAHAAFAPEIVRAMRVFARRQRTWLKARDVSWLTPEDADRAELPSSVEVAWRGG
jgi:tRNA dimethylallyltransferase